MNLTNAIKGYLKKKEFVLKEDKLLDSKGNLVIDLKQQETTKIRVSSSNITL